MPSAAAGLGTRMGRRRSPTAASVDLRLVVFAILLTLMAALGGSSRADAWQLLLLRPGAVVLATVLLLLPGPQQSSTLRMPALLLAGLALTAAFQLVPLPPGWWTLLPGHASYLEAADISGVTQPWRPITVSFDATLNSLIAMAMPCAILLGAAALRLKARLASAAIVIGLGVVSALVGLLQVTLGELYLYSPTSIGRPVGLFANINHQAAWLAAIIPVCAGWAVSQSGRTALRHGVAAAAGVLLFATVLVSGSRSGLLLAILAVLAVPLVLMGRVRLTRRVKRLAIAGASIGLILLIAAIWASGRLGALDRLLAGDLDQRVDFLPLTLGLLRDFAPFGSGFGTFDPVFRSIEPDAALRLTYFNHAHNDLLELGITGEVPAVVIVLVGAAWLMRRALTLWGAGRGAATTPMARGGLLAASILLLASLTDYLVRTPLAAALLALAALWAADRPQTAE